VVRGAYPTSQLLIAQINDAATKAAAVLSSPSPTSSDIGAVLDSIRQAATLATQVDSQYQSALAQITTLNNKLIIATSGKPPQTGGGTGLPVAPAAPNTLSPAAAGGIGAAFGIVAGALGGYELGSRKRGKR
jgi:hypothetical protein